MRTPKPECYVGMPVDRVEGRYQVTGHARYTADVQLSDLTYAVIVH